MMNRIFQIYGYALLILLFFGHWYGWAPYADVDRINDVPKSVRDNPGSYRSVYLNYQHYHGGK